MSEPKHTPNALENLNEIYEAAIRWNSADADYPDTPPEAWQNAFMRAAACVNACEGIATENLYDGMLLDRHEGERAQADRAEKAEQQRDELRKLLTDVYNADRTDNNGAYMGEATLCPSFARRAADLLAKLDQ